MPCVEGVFQLQACVLMHVSEADLSIILELDKGFEAKERARLGIHPDDDGEENCLEVRHCR